MVDIGLPDMPAPQALPEVWPGYSSTSAGSVSKRWCRVSWICPAISVSRPARSGRPALPTNRVSPVSTNHGVSARRLSVTTRQIESGVWPGVCSTSTKTLPTTMRWPSLSASKG
ncbi:MAG: hypothetical protein ABS89_09270 [Thiobacillus sp. SCN 63-1177]|nr:MAG: hypothetical protein ABS89_09270 [Thiobacillus sp. SCN 63-1177]